MRSGSEALPAEEPMMRVRKRLSCNPGGLRARAVPVAVRDEEVVVVLSKRMIRDELEVDGCEPWLEDERLCIRNMPGLAEALVGYTGSVDVSLSSPGVDDELADRCHGFGSRAALLSSLRRWRSSVDVSRGEDESCVGKMRGDGKLAVIDAGDAVPGTRTGDEDGGELVGGSEMVVTLDEDPSMLDFLKRLRSDSLGFSFRGGVASAPVPADFGRRETFGNEGR